MNHRTEESPSWLVMLFCLALMFWLAEMGIRWIDSLYQTEVSLSVEEHALFETYEYLSLERLGQAVDIYWDVNVQYRGTETLFTGTTKRQLPNIPSIEFERKDGAGRLFVSTRDLHRMSQLEFKTLLPDIMQATHAMAAEVEAKQRRMDGKVLNEERNRLSWES